MHYKDKHKEVLSWFPDIKNIVEKYRKASLGVETKKSERDLVTVVDRAVEDFIISKIKKTFPSDEIVGEESQFIEVNKSTALAEQGEEAFSTNSDASSYDSVSTADDHVSFEKTWFIDPIDGTNNFVKQGRDYCVLIAYYEKRIGCLAYIYDLPNDDLYYAIVDEGAYKNNEAIPKAEDVSISQALVSCSLAFEKMGAKYYLDLEHACFGLRYYGCGGYESLKVISSELVAFINHASEPWDIASSIIFAKELGLKISNFAGEDLTYPRKTHWLIANPKAHAELLKISKNNVPC